MLVALLPEYLPATAAGTYSRGGLRYAGGLLKQLATALSLPAPNQVARNYGKMNSLIVSDNADGLL